MAGEDDRVCECGAPARCAADRHIPVEFDEEMNEYHLVREGARTVMRYCFKCGGRLPESKRGSFFTTPSESELAEVRALLKGATSHEDVVRILGSPDEVHDMGGFEKDSATGAILARWNRHFRYTKRWKSLVLDVPVILEGRFAWSIHGHDLGRGEPGARGPLWSDDACRSWPLRPR